MGLVAAELGSAIPQEGGYYKWVQRACGEFWGFQAGWWRTISIYFDNTIYVVLAGSYLANVAKLSDAQEYAVKAAIVVFFVAVEISFVGFYLSRCRWYERVILFVSAGLLFVFLAGKVYWALGAGLAIFAAASRANSLKKLDIPTLVIHGDADPLIPIECGIATAKAIPGARMTTIAGMGHDLPEALVPRLTRLIAQHAQAVDSAGDQQVRPANPREA